MVDVAVLVPEVANILGVRIGMNEADVRARFPELYLQSESEETGGTCAFCATPLPDGQGELNIQFLGGQVRAVAWIMKLDAKEVSELSKVVRAHLKRVYGVSPVGADKVYRSENPVRHFAWTTKWGFDPTSFKLEMFPGNGRD